MRAPVLVGVHVLAVLLACARAPGPVLDAAFPEGRLTLDLVRRAEAVRLTADEDLRVEEVGRDASTSHHLVWVRDREALHRHERHDLLVVILRGHGAMRLGGEERRVGDGSVLYVPRGLAHAFRNEAAEPAVAYVVYVPPFDGTDRVLVQESCDPQVLRCSLPHQGQKPQ